MEGQPLYVPLYRQGCISLPFAVFPAVLAPDVWHREKTGKAANRHTTAFWARVLWPNQARGSLDPTRRLASYDLLLRLRHSVGLSPLAAFERRVVKKHTKGFTGHKLVAAFVRILGCVDLDTSLVSADA